MGRMQSLRELYRIGFGPSSSHTIGVGAAAEHFYRHYPTADRFDVVLYGSLSLTGVGHGTDKVLRQVLAPAEVKIRFDREISEEELRHPNTFDIEAYNGDKLLGKARFYSTGGGAIQAECVNACERCVIKEKLLSQEKLVYELSSFNEIREHCVKHNKRLSEYVFDTEGDGIREYLHTCWRKMKDSIRNGLDAEGVLPGGLDLLRSAKKIYAEAKGKARDRMFDDGMNLEISAFAVAVAEENAGGGVIVTAPTCGSCGVVPAVLYFAQVHCGFDDESIVKALAAGGLVGNIVKTNASISGAECGCQAEIGTACCMAAAALAELYSFDIKLVEYAAQSAMQHFLGLTCDPIAGLVQVPCIERNAAAAVRAVNAAGLAAAGGAYHIPLDTVIRVMYETGKDLQAAYRETSRGGLAKAVETAE